MSEAAYSRSSRTRLRRGYRAAAVQSAYDFATLTLIPSVVLLLMGLHKARPIDCSSALFTSPLVEPGVCFGYQLKNWQPQIAVISFLII